jgi:hypothetical protein
MTDNLEDLQNLKGIKEIKDLREDFGSLLFIKNIKKIFY